MKRSAKFLVTALIGGCLAFALTRMDWRSSITFDEAMHRGYAITTTGVREIKRHGYRCPDIVGIGEWDDARRTVRWRCQGLEVGETHALPIRPRTFHDLSGNECETLDLVFPIAERE